MGRVRPVDYAPGSRAAAQAPAPVPALPGAGVPGHGGRVRNGTPGDATVTGMLYVWWGVLTFVSAKDKPQ